MAHKHLLVQSAAREKVLHGAAALADAVRVTLGPKSKCVFRAIDAVEHEASACVGDERTGALILKRALETPTRQIAENSGVDGGVVVDRMRGGSGAYGFDASRGTYVDLIDAGISME